MLNFNGESYNLDFLLQFQVLKQLLEALAKKQLEMDFLLYGSQKGKKSQNTFFSNQNTFIDNSGEDINDNDTSKNNIMEIMDLYGLKGGIKQNNDLIISLTKKIEDLENKNNDKMKIIESMESSEKEEKQKIQLFEEKMDEIQKKIDVINRNTESYLSLIDNNKNELMGLIKKNTKDIKNNTDSIEQMKNSINEYINGKINQMKYSLNEELTKKLDDLQDNIKETTEKNIDIFNEKIDKINKTIKEHETKIFSIEDNLNKIFEDFNNKLNSLISFKNEQKSKNIKFSQDINNLKLMSENFNHNILRINELLETNTLQNLLNDLNSFSNKVVNLEEYKKTIDLINSHLKTLQSENNQYRRYFEDILPLIGKITTAEDLKKLEQLLRELLEEQDSNAQKKYADKSEILKNIKNITNQIKLLMSK
jgi:chromosome segregation ATPase